MTRMGLTVDCFPFGRKGATALDLLDYCHSLGSLDAGHARKVRERAEKLGLYLEVWATLPREDAGEFERTVVAAKQAGATRLRAFCLGGRRYEVFTTLEEWKRFVAESRGRIRRALPILEKHRLPLGLENHKDWTTEEMLALMKEFSGDYFGVCLDVGNNISFLDDVVDMVERLAPFTIATHMKDMAVEEYEEGFLLVEAPFGDGMLDVKRIVETVRKARPDTSFTLEMMTRSPLKIPCLTPKYWVTFPDRSSARLARALRTVRANRPRKPLPQVEGLTPTARVQLEEDNVRRCLDYARQHLGL